MIYVLVVIPTYNESESIQSLLDRLNNVRQEFADMYKIDILIVDDNSPDNTAAIAANMHLSGLEILQRREKLGLGPAYLAGFAHGLKNDYQYFVQMDADLSHQPEQLVDLLNAAAKSDLVIICEPDGSFRSRDSIRLLELSEKYDAVFTTRTNSKMNFYLK